ncbi:MAG TPA: hypothetical protein PKI03_25670, partial [Pseudomonadota bacterium]|nr:hypothetical protein [Pseudomonadota bacterium]
MNQDVPQSDATAPPNGSGQAAGAGTAQRPLYLRMFMDKTQGLTLEVLDALGINQQSLTMDGTTITTRVSGSGGDSIIRQTADSVTIDARNFTVQAENIRMNSTLGSTYQSMGSTSVNGLAGLTLFTPASMSLCGLNGVTTTGLSVSTNAMQSINMLAIGGGVSLCGAATGVQLFGSDVSATAVSISLNAPTISVLTPSLIMSAIPIPPTGASNSTSGVNAAKGASAAPMAASAGLSGSGALYGMGNSAGMGGNAGSADTGSLLNMGSAGMWGPTSSMSGGGKAFGIGNTRLPPNTSAQIGQATQPYVDAAKSMVNTGNQMFNTWANYVSPVFPINSPFNAEAIDTLQKGLQSGNPLQMYQAYTKNNSEMLKSTTDTLMPLMVLSTPYGLAAAFGAYYVVELTKYCSDIAGKLQSGTVTAGDLLASTTIG